MKKCSLRRKRWLLLIVMLFAGMLHPGTVLKTQAREEGITVEMPGFVVTQRTQPTPMLVTKDAPVRVLPDQAQSQLGALKKDTYVNAWGETNTGWYIVECAGTLGYVRYEAAVPLTQEQMVVLQQDIQRQALLKQEEERQALEAERQAQLQAQEAERQAQLQALEAERQAQLQAQEAARQVQLQAQEAARQAQLQALEATKQTQIQAAAGNQPAVAAGVVFIGDSRMVTLKEAVEKEFGICPVSVVAQNGARCEWLRSTGIPRADAMIGKGTKVLINMGVNDMNAADKYLETVNFWAAVWTQRGAQVYYASVNPVYANMYNKTEEQVTLFNQRLHNGLIPQVVWIDSNTYLKQTGVESWDGLHYRPKTDLVLYHYYMTMIGMA